MTQSPVQKPTPWNLTLVDGAPPAASLWSLAVADIDGDGNVEIVTGGEHILLWYRPATMESGTIGTPALCRVGLALGDVDGDGRMEAVMTDQPVQQPSHTMGLELALYKQNGGPEGTWERRVLDPNPPGGARHIDGG